jgi:hypothetical protein
MSARAARTPWMPALMVGAATAIAAEVAIGILLYASVGFMRSLTTVLAIEGVALAAGLHTAPSGERPELVERLRRRWLFCLGTFIAAAIYGTLWSLFEGLGGGRFGQGVGLALLAGLPMFACGSLLGGMGALAEDDTSGLLLRPGAAAALGAGLGFVATGALLPRAPIPASLLVGCLVLLSGGGMIYGALIDASAEPEPGAPTLDGEAPPEEVAAEESVAVATEDASPSPP